MREAGSRTAAVDHLYGRHVLCNHIRQLNIPDLVVCSPDIAFEQDGWRSNKAVRGVQQAHILQDLHTRGRRYTLLTGSVQERVAQVASLVT